MGEGEGSRPTPYGPVRPEWQVRRAPAMHTRADTARLRSLAHTSMGSADGGASNAQHPSHAICFRYGSWRASEGVPSTSIVRASHARRLDGGSALGMARPRITMSSAAGRAASARFGAARTWLLNAWPSRLWLREPRSAGADSIGPGRRSASRCVARSRRISATNRARVPFAARTHKPRARRRRRLPADSADPPSPCQANPNRRDPSNDDARRFVRDAGSRSRCDSRSTGKPIGRLGEYGR